MVPNKISTFIQFEPNERFEREFFIAHTNLKRFTAAAILITLVGCLYIVPGLILLAYFSLRKLKITYCYATITDRRVVYYEYNLHESENYHYVKSIHLSDITGMQMRLDRTLFRKSFWMWCFTEFKALDVGAEGWLGLWNIFGSSKRLEPGPDALDFIQHLSGQVAAHQFAPPTAAAAATP